MAQEMPVNDRPTVEHKGRRAESAPPPDAETRERIFGHLLAPVGGATE